MKGKENKELVDVCWVDTSVARVERLGYWKVERSENYEQPSEFEPGLHLF